MSTGVKAEVKMSVDRSNHTSDEKFARELSSDKPSPETDQDENTILIQGDEENSGLGEVVEKLELDVTMETEIDLQKSRIEVTAKRYVILAIFCSYSMTSAYQWIHLNVIYDVVASYYNTSLPDSEYLQSLAIDSLSMVYMLTYIPLVFPANWILDKKGLRFVSLLGTLLNCIGAWIKCTATTPDRFPVLMTGQVICGVAQVFIIGMPAKVAATWFDASEVSTATAFGVFGNQLGVALGFVLPPYLVRLNAYDLSEMGRSLSYMFYGGAAYTTALFLLVVLVFDEKPIKPPSLAQYRAMSEATDLSYAKSLQRLFKTCPFVILLIAYGLNVGVFYGVSTLLSPILSGYFKLSDFPDFAEDVGRIGLTIVVSGLFGSVICGVILDRTKLFKVTTVAVYLLSLAGLIVFTYTLHLKKVWLVYITAGSLGFFMTGYLPVGFEFAVELTYPQSEGISSGLLNASAQTFGILLTLLMGQIIRLSDENEVNTRNSLLAASGALLLGTILTDMAMYIGHHGELLSLRLYQLVTISGVENKSIGMSHENHPSDV